MAELLKILREVEDFKNELFCTYSRAEENRLKENRAATRIQSWFRACKVRAHLSHLHMKATVIQRTWRGFAARARFRQTLKAAYFIAKMNFYEEMAVRIQRRWRGFFVRKYVHDFYTRKSYLVGVHRKNELVRTELNELDELQKRQRICLETVKEQTAKLHQVHRLHHLLSTKQVPGVFNSPLRPAPHEMEPLLRQVKYRTPPRGRAGPRTPPGPGLPGSRTPPRGRAGPRTPPGPGLPGSPGVPTCPRPILPPIASKKQQGPPRRPGEVWEQNVLHHGLTLRLQNSYKLLEEAQEQLRLHQYRRIPTNTLGTGTSRGRESFTQRVYADGIRS